MEQPQKEFEKRLSRNGWQCRLYKYVYGKEFKGRAYCLFFWKLHLGCLLLPFVFLGKKSADLLELIADFWPKSPEVEKEWFPTLDWFEHADSTMQYIRISMGVHCSSLIDYVEKWIQDEKVTKWFKENDWQKYRADLEKKREALLKYDAEVEALNTARRAKIEAKKEKIVNFLQYFVKPALAASAILVGWAIWKFVAWIIGAMTWVIFWNIAGIAGIFLGIIGAALVIVFFCHWASEKSWKIKLPGFILKVFSAIGEGAIFLVETVKMVYDKKCPLIIWADETEKIQKRKSEE